MKIERKKIRRSGLALLLTLLLLLVSCGLVRKPESEVYRPVAESNLLHSLASAFGLSSLDRADLAACAEEYLRGIGPGGAQIAALKENLSKNYPAPQA